MRLSLALVGKTMLSKSLIPFSAYGWGYVPSYGRSNGDLLQKELCQHTTPPGTAAISVLDPLAGHCQGSGALTTTVLGGPAFWHKSF